jgi:hypothetical protein
MQQEQAQQNAKLAMMKQHSLVVAYETRLADQQDDANDQISVLQAQMDTMSTYLRQTVQRQKVWD